MVVSKNRAAAKTGADPSKPRSGQRRYPPANTQNAFRMWRDSNVPKNIAAKLCHCAPTSLKRMIEKYNADLAKAKTVGEVAEKKRTPQAPVRGAPPKLTVEAEQHLCDIIQFFSVGGEFCNLSRRDIEDLAVECAARGMTFAFENAKDKKKKKQIREKDNCWVVSKNWFKGFLTRHPEYQKIYNSSRNIVRLHFRFVLFFMFFFAERSHQYK